VFLTATAIAAVSGASQASGAVVVTSPTEGATVSGVVPVRVAMEATDRIRTTRIVAGRRAIIRSVDHQTGGGVAVFVDTAILGKGAQTIVVVATDRFGKTRVLRRHVVVTGARANARRHARTPAFRFVVPTPLAAGAAAAIGFAGRLGNGADQVQVRLDGRLISSNLVRRGAFARVTSYVSGSRLKAGRHVLRAVVRTDGALTSYRRAVVVREPATPPPGGGGVLPGALAFTGDFETGDFSQWRNAKGFSDGVIQSQAADRVRIVRSPAAQGSFAARFEVRPGDRAASGNRAEVLHGTNEHEGDERWYQWHTNFDPSYPRNGNWQIFTQWHAAQGHTQPMVRFNANNDSISFSTTESSSAGSPGKERVHWSGPMNRGTWHTFRLHAKWSSSRSVGFVELYYDGTLVVPKTPVATMIPGIDRAYVKQGLYRSPKTSGTSVLYHDGFTMSIVK
jgi:hypothetical protein